MKHILVMLMLFCAAGIIIPMPVNTEPVPAKWPDSVVRFTIEKGKTKTVSGRLENGKPIEDLSWAADSSVACFPATQNSKFRGNHVFFVVPLPSRSIMEVKLIPKDPGQNLSLYGYSIGLDNFRLPPQMRSCVACEADHKWDRPKRNMKQDHTRSISFNAIKNPYNVVICVTGPKEAVKGDFILEVTLK